MHEFADRLLSKRRKGAFRSRPVFERYAEVAAEELAATSQRIGRPIPPDFASWLTLVGYGDIDQTLSFRSEWFQPVQEGELRGGLLFAQDEVGNFYAFGPTGEAVVFFSRTEPTHAVLASSFREFLVELERRDYKLIDWVDSLEMLPYAWTAA